MSKLPKVGTTIFTIMSQLANQCGAINLSQGFPNFPIDPKLEDILKETASQSVHQYMPMSGFPELNLQICHSIQNSYKRTVLPDQNVLVTAGATQAIFTTILALVNVGDEVVMLDPSYDCYEPAIILAGGIPIRVPLQNDFLPDWELIEKSINRKTRMLITNNPHNPSGRIWDQQDVDTLEKIILRNEKLLLLSDEVYEYIAFEKKHISINGLSSIYDRTIIVSSFGKTFHITGWKVGYIVTSENLMVEIKKVHQFNVFSVNSVAQATLAKYLPTVELDALGGFYQQKRDLFRSLLAESNFDLMPCEGTYFQVADYSRISTANDVEFCRTLATEFGVAAIPISVFHGDLRDDKKIRFCFAKDDDTLIQATQRLCRL